MSEERDLGQDYHKGRGAQLNPQSRFMKLSQGESFDDLEFEDPDLLKTKFIEVFPKTIVNRVPSPDIGLYYSLNPYQGCEHGCTYCYARPTHEYWGYSAGIDFERIIMVKKNAAELLEIALQKKSWVVEPISISGNTDCYQPCEKEYELTRKLLEVLLSYKHPVGMITKNALICRDIDLLSELAKLNLVAVSISITSLREELRRVLEPRTSSIKNKLKTIEKLTLAGVPVNVMMAPIIPALNDDEIFAMGKAVSEHGALSMHYQIARLNGPNGGIFTDWVTKNYPDRASKVLNQLKEIHGGTLSASRFGTRMKGEGNFSMNIQNQFKLAQQTFFKGKVFPKLDKTLFSRPNESEQLSLF